MGFEDMFRNVERSLGLPYNDPFHSFAQHALSVGRVGSMSVLGQMQQAVNALGRGQLDLVQQMARSLNAMHAGPLQGQMEMYRRMAEPPGVGVARAVEGLARIGSMFDSRDLWKHALGSLSALGPSQSAFTAMTYGMVGSISARSAFAHLAEGTIDETPLGQALARVDEVAEDSATSLADLFEGLIQGGVWALLPEPVRTRLRKLTFWQFLTLLSFFVQCYAAYGQAASGEKQAAVDAEHTALFRQSVALQQSILEEMRGIVVADGFGPEVRAIRRRCPIYSARSGKSELRTVLERGDHVVVLEVRKRWAMVALADLVTGQPMLGWVRKKCTKVRRGRWRR